MAITGTDKLGVALGFIPVASTVVALVKAFIYFNRRPSESRADKSKVENCAKEVQLVSKGNFDTEPILQNNGNNPALAKYNWKKMEYHAQRAVGVFFQLIPVLNIIGAAFELAALKHLDKAQSKYDKAITTAPCPPKAPSPPKP